jgi:hypothetical protein
LVQNFIFITFMSFNLIKERKREIRWIPVEKKLSLTSILTTKNMDYNINKLHTMKRSRWGGVETLSWLKKLDKGQERIFIFWFDFVFLNCFQSFLGC